MGLVPLLLQFGSYFSALGKPEERNCRVVQLDCLWAGAVFVSCVGFCRRWTMIMTM